MNSTRHLRITDPSLYDTIGTRSPRFITHGCACYRGWSARRVPMRFSDDERLRKSIVFVLDSFLRIDLSRFELHWVTLAGPLLESFFDIRPDRGEIKFHTRVSRNHRRRFSGRESNSWRRRGTEREREAGGRAGGGREKDPDFIFVDELGGGPACLNIYPLFLRLSPGHLLLLISVAKLRLGKALQAYRNIAELR